MADIAISLVVSPIINKIIDAATSLIEEEILSIHRVKEDVTKLKNTLTTIQSTLSVAEERQLKEPSLRNWLGKLKNAAYDAEDILDALATETCLWKRKQKSRKVRPPFSATKAFYQYDAAQKIKKISARLDEIAQERQKFLLNFTINVDVEISKSQNHPQTGFFVDTPDVFGREADKERLINLLISDEYDKEGDICVIPIIGMGGLGKTTLAQFIFNEIRVKDHFESRMWVSVTADFNLSRILKEMIEFHSKMKFADNLSHSLLESRLMEFVVRKRFLLVLDDVWNEDYDKWEKLLRILKQGDKGSRVLVTGRSDKVSKVMGTQPTYHLDYLPEDKCWSLFEKIAFRDCDSSSDGERRELECIGREITSKCKGLPLAVKAMAGILRGETDVKKWQTILASDVWKLEDGISKPNILPALRLSYDYLPSYIKQCFTYCSIFPKAYVFRKEELVKLWIAEGFIQSNSEKTGIEYFDELLVKSFFQSSNIDNKVRYNMHDLIHDLAQSISTLEYCQVKDMQSCDCSEESRHISLLCQDVEQPALKIVNQSKKLRTLLLPTGHVKNFGQALEKIFDSLKYIRVLDLSSSHLQELPSSIEKLMLLRYLDLSGTEIKFLPNSLCKLYNLQTLKLLGCLWLYELPKHLAKLVNLQHLELDEMFWFKCTMLPPSIGSLISLQNMHAFRVGCGTGFGIAELGNMECLTGTLHISNLENAVEGGNAKLNDKKHLQKLVFQWSSRDVSPQNEAAEEKMLEDLQPNSNLKELQICHYKGSKFPAWITDGLLRNLVVLSFNYCTNCKILSLGHLPHLGELYIKGMQELEEWPEMQCPSLHRLKISNCPKLRKLPDIFPNLRALKIKKCGSVQALPVTPSLMFSIIVDNLVLADWKEAMVQYAYQDDQGQVLTRIQPSFINLLELKVISCPKLPGLPKIFAPQKLEINGCELMSSLPVLQFAQRLQHLALSVCQDGTLVRAIPNAEKLYSLVLSNISNLASLPRWPHLPGLKALYISDCEDLMSLSEEEEDRSLKSLTSLEFLSIRGCPKLKTLPDGLPNALKCLIIGSCSHLQFLGTKQTLKNLTSLKDLYIECCPLLQSFLEDGLPTSLQHLLIQECPQLTECCQKDGGGPEWPKIMNVPDPEINSIKVSSAPDLRKNKRSSAWYRLTFFGEGSNRNGKTKPGEVSTSAEHGP